MEGGTFDISSRDSSSFPSRLIRHRFANLEFARMLNLNKKRDSVRQNEQRNDEKKLGNKSFY